MKQFFTYAQQIQKMQDDGLTIPDVAFATEKLKFEGYYNLINGYSPIFKSNNKYVSGTTFGHIYALYEFDKKLRDLIYQRTLYIETNVKALIAHEFSRVHGVDETVYLQLGSFSPSAVDAVQVKRLIDTCNQTIADAISPHTNTYRHYVAHNKKKHNHVPMWVLVRALTFGTTSIFYKYMLRTEQTAVAANYNLTADQLNNMLEVIVSFRNIVAHGERTYCARLPKARLSTALSIFPKLCLPLNKRNEVMYGRNDLLSLLICFKYLLPAGEFSRFLSEFGNCIEELGKQIPPNVLGRVKTQMGLKTNSWKNLPKITI